MIFYIIDGFTKQLFQGNTAGVVIYEQLDEALMQKFASELKFSEVAFVKYCHNSIDMRYFTPLLEIDFCGHATISAYHALLDCGLIDANEVNYIKNKSGIMTIYKEKDYIMLEQASPILRESLGEIDIAKLCSIMNIKKEAIGDEDFCLKPQISSTGLYDIMLPVKDMNILNALNPDFEKLLNFSKEKEVVGVHAFCLDKGDEVVARCRNFAPLYGINEESATGSASGALTYYLYKNKVLKEFDKSYTIIQGENLGRPSKIVTKIINKSEEIKILCGGSCKTLLKCNLEL